MRWKKSSEYNPQEKKFEGCWDGDPGKRRDWLFRLYYNTHGVTQLSLVPMTYGLYDFPNKKLGQKLKEIVRRLPVKKAMALVETILTLEGWT